MQELILKTCHGPSLQLLPLFVEMNLNPPRDATKLDVPTQIYSNEVVLEGLSASLDGSITAGTSTKGPPFNLRLLVQESPP